jgi:sterol 3beta-glucosyltransferase
VSKVVIAVIGSRGEVAPMTGIGARLRDAGHEVTLAAYAEFGDLVRSSGLKFREIDPARVDGSDVNPLAGLRDFFAPSGQRAIGDRMIAVLRDEPTDVLLLSPLAELAGHPLAEAKDVPSIGVRLQPLSATVEYPPAVLGSWTAGSRFNKASSNAGAWMIDRLYASTVAGFRNELGLPKMSASQQRCARTEAEWQILHGYSPEVLPRPQDWRPGLDVVGYWWPARPTQWQPPDELVAFLDNGPAPVFVGFGSMMKTKAAAERISTTVVDALRAAETRGVIQAGWAGLDVSGDGVLTIGDVPHDWLFDRVAAAVHHCGAGTAAAGLRAGVPTVGVPAMGDQPFWARRLSDLGVSSATIPQRRLNAELLSAAIRVALNDSTIRDNAERLASRIAAEDGAGRVLDAVNAADRST